MAVTLSARDHQNLLRLIVDEWIEVALEQTGLGERGQNNAGRDVWKFCNPARTPRNKRRKTWGAWCAAFLVWCLEEAVLRVAERLGLTLRQPIRRTHSARKLGQRVGRFGVFIKRGKGQPRVGDIVVKRRGHPGQRHVELVVLGPDERGRYKTIGGNVGSFKRTRGQVDLHWQYLDDPDTVGWARLFPGLLRGPVPLDAGARVA